MVWAAWGERWSDLYELARDFETKKIGYPANSYIELLDDNLLLIQQPGLILMRDSVPIHKAKKVMRLFEDNGIMNTDWPSYSPGSNPIEHLWYKLKNLVYKANLDIGLITGSNDTVFEALWKPWKKPGC